LSQNYPDLILAFAAAFRGLLESAADTRYALGEVPKALASTFRLAHTAMRGQLSAMVWHQSLRKI